MLHIEQEVPSSQLSVLETVLATDLERIALLAEAKELEEEAASEGASEAASEASKTDEDLADEAERLARLKEVLERLDEIDSATAPSRCRVACKCSPRRPLSPTGARAPRRDRLGHGAVSGRRHLIRAGLRCGDAGAFGGLLLGRLAHARGARPRPLHCARRAVA